MKVATLIGVVAVIGLAASGKWWLGAAEAAGKGPSSATRAKVQRGDLRIAVEENGFLAAKDNVKISPKFKGSGTIAVLVEEGKTVAPGDILVEFDRTQLETQITELENQLTQYKIELEAAKANLEIAERDNQAAIEKAELALQMARLTKDRYEQGDAPNELRKLELAAEKAASALERARERFQQVPELVAQGFLTRIQEEEERIALREAEINDENAKKDLELHRSYTVRMEATKRETEVRDAERELENARKKADINLKEKQAALAQRERQVKSTENRLEQQRKELEHYTIRAENPGIVQYGDPENPWWRQEVKIGNDAYQGQTLITIPDLTTMQVLLQIHEDDIDKLRLDMPVVVTIESKKGQTYTGKITEIASVAASSRWNDDTNKSFKVEVTLDSAGGDLRAGVTAKAEILVETLTDVLYVPIHAVVAEGGKHLTFLVQDAGHVEREVEIGKNNAHYVQVLAGLAEGDEVLLYDPRKEGEAGTTATARRETEEPAERPLPGAPAE